jgi:hypothetical protein
MSLKILNNKLSTFFLNGLQAYWSLDNSSWLDSGPNGFNLTPINTVSVGTGIINGCAVFNGSSCLSNSRFPAAGATALTMSCWINTTFNGNNWLVSISANNDRYCGYDYSIVGTTIYNTVFVNNNATYDRVTYTASNLLDGNWHHIVMTWVKGGSMNIYYDGVLVATGATSGKAMNSTLNYPLHIGSNGNFGYGIINGSLDEMGLWNRELSANEVSILYNAVVGNNLLKFLTTNTSGTQSNIKIISGYPSVALVTYLVVAGGGGGANTVQNGVGGAGAGAALQGNVQIPLGQAVTITVGAGGAPGSNGSNSVLYNIVALGGGKPGVYQGTGASGPSSGGCGAGASRNNALGGGVGIQGGNGGGESINGYSSAGGGGGAGGNGYNGNTDGPSLLITSYSKPYPSTGGSGIINTIQGSTLGQAIGSNPVVYWVSGGGGGAFFNGGTDDAVNFPAGGNGGGGNGASSNGNLNGTSGSTNTGGGAGAAINKIGLSGGSGGIALQIPSIHTVTFSAGVTYTLETTINGYNIYKITATSTTSETITIN